MLDVAGFARALELAIDRRERSLLIDRDEAEVELARARLARLSGDLARALPGLSAPRSPDDVIPFKDAARRYLEAASRLFPGDAKALAQRLGASYFALRRLLARYEVPFPARAVAQTGDIFAPGHLWPARARSGIALRADVAMLPCGFRNSPGGSSQESQTCLVSQTSSP